MVSQDYMFHIREEYHRTEVLVMMPVIAEYARAESYFGKQAGRGGCRIPAIDL